MSLARLLKRGWQMRWRFALILAALYTPAAFADCGENNEQCLPGQPGDVSLDGDVDLDDHAEFISCLDGPQVPLAGSCYPADFDHDGDVDVADAILLQIAFTGACTCPPPSGPVEALFVASPYLGEVPLTVTFDASRTNGVISTLDWDFGDGGTASGQVVEHTFTQPGDFTITLTATGPNAEVDSKTFVVTVSDGSFDLQSPVTPNEARRFLWQAAYGPLQQDIDYIVANGYEAWIDAQLAEPATLMLVEYLEESIDMEYGYNPDTIWDDVCVDSGDQLRQRMAWALLQILVMNNPQDTASADMVYYSAYIDRALGNYRDLLGYVTSSHHMGVFLTYINNLKADPNAGTVPDENYAREVMQLFSIGLTMLNLDGTQQLDVSGNPIPTYDNETVQQFARIFTGFRWGTDYALAMPMISSRHEFGAKQLLNYPGAVPANGFIPAINSPAQQTEAAALADVGAALDNLFHHPNCAPFICDLLIKRLVTSNPTPAYVERVAQAFEGNGPYGSGVRGDLFATVKAILLDNEARDPAYRSNPYYGKVLEPLVVRWGLYRILERVDRPAEVFPFRINAGPYQNQLDFGQSFMGSPSVFNFYLPNYIPPITELAAAGMYAPEVQIYNDFTAMATQNRFHQELVTVGGAQESGKYNEWRALSGNPSVLVATLNDELMHGSLSPESTQIIVNALTAITGDTDRVRTAVWLMVNSPEFRVLK